MPSTPSSVARRWRRAGALRRALAAATALALIAVPLLAAPDPMQPPSSGGVVSLYRLLARLDSHKRVLVVGAHPDDEDTTLLALVSLGMGGEAAYLSLSRGEGGQNLIGPELGPELGLVRSQELLAARRVDGARQFFTRAFDFGFTRSLEETRGRWPDAEVLEDTVRIVRRFKPQVLVSVFPPTAEAGHGQHQAAGVAAHEAFTAAGDATRFPALVEQGLPPWQPAVLYRSAFFRPTPDSLVLPTGPVDAGSGKTYFQLAMASRSMHRSQDMGVLQDLGPRSTGVTWVAGARPESPPPESSAPGGGRGLGPFARPVAGTQAPVAARGDLFAGIDTRLQAIAATLPPGSERAALSATLASISTEVEALHAELAASRLEAAAPRLRSIVDRLEDAIVGLGSSAVEAGARGAVLDLLDEKLDLAREALAVASGWVFDATTDAPALVPGTEATVRVTFYNSGAEPAQVTPSLRVADAAGWTQPTGEPRDVAPGALESWDLELAVPAGAGPTVPYFLVRPRRGDLYDWTGVPAELRGEPFGPPVLVAAFGIRSGGTALETVREVVHRYRDQAVGERREPLRVVPRLELAVTPERMLWPRAASSERTLKVTLRKNGTGEVAGRLEVETPGGWAKPQPVPFRLEANRDSRTVEVPLERGGAGSGGGGADRAEVRVSARLDDGVVASGAYPLIDYPHIRAVPSPHPSVVDVLSLDLALPPLGSVAYVRGASDRVPESLLEVGLPLQLLTGEQILDQGDGELDRFDAIILGSRAYEVDPRLAEANQRLLDYVRDGGLLLVQYEQYDFVQGKLAPFPLTIARPHDRITDETAAAELLQPDHPAFHRPNRLGPADWDGWVQERGLYFAHDWDPAYRPLLRFTDPGMGPQEGGLLVASLGKGTYVYTGLAFFRQLPEGVPGAFRLFMNLLALGG